MTGFVDAIAFARTGTFVANMTGNTVLVGIGVGEGSASAALPPLLAIGAFLAGSAVAARIRHAAPEPHASRRALLGGELVLLVAVAAAVVVQGGDGSSWGGDALVIGLGSLAMALQTHAVRQVGGIQVSTTFDTGMVSALGAALASRAARGALVLGTLIGVYAAGAALGGVVAATGARPAALAAPLVIAAAWVALGRRSEG